MNTALITTMIIDWLSADAKRIKHHWPDNKPFFTKYLEDQAHHYMKEFTLTDSERQSINNHVCELTQNISK